MITEQLSDVSDLEDGSECETIEGSNSEMSVDEDDEESHVTFASESVTSEYPQEPDKYDQRIDAEEEKRTLKKMKGTTESVFLNHRFLIY